MTDDDSVNWRGATVLRKDMGRRIASIRNSQDLTQVELAKRTGFCVGTIKKAEKGDDVEFETYRTIAEALRVDMEALLERPGCPGVGRRQFLGAASLSTAAAETVLSLRRAMDEMLNAEAKPESTIEYWEAIADGYGRRYRTTPPAVFLMEISADLAELRGLIIQRLPTTQRRHLHHASGRMAGLIATTFVNLGEYNEARAWFYTAFRAAEESDDCSLQAWVNVRQAVSALYWGDPRGSADLAYKATLRARGQNCLPAAWAPAVQARALARMGESKSACNALIDAERAFGRLQTPPHDQYVYGYTAAQLHFYRSNTLTTIRDRAAYAAQDAALEYYGPDEVLDSSLVRLDRVSCLFQEGRFDEGASYAADTVIRLPSRHRSPIVLERAGELATSIPRPFRSVPSVQELEQALLVPPLAGTGVS